MNKYIISGLLLISILVPVFSHAEEDIDPTPNTSSCVSISNNLRYQSRDVNTNGEVSTLQDFLQSKGYLNNEPTGYFGILTVAAVKSFQSANGINPTGYVGPVTRAKIKALTCGGVTVMPTPTPVSSGCAGGAVYSSTTGQPCGTTNTSSCSTPDPFTSLGGGTCVNGGWLPPNHPLIPASSDPFIIINGANWVAQKGFFYSTAILVAGGPSGTTTNMYNWSVSSGSLPPGLGLTASDGGEEIAGTPTRIGTYHFSLTASTRSLSEQDNFKFATDTKPFTITVLDSSSQTLSITTTPPLPSGKEGTQYKAYIYATSDLSLYTWSVSSGSLPAELTLTASNDCGITNSGMSNVSNCILIYGTPIVSKVNEFTLKVTAINSAGNTLSATKRFSLTIDPANTTQPYISSINPSSGPVGATVTIFGSGFSTIADQNSIDFAGTNSIFASSPDGRTLTFHVPSITPKAYTVSVSVRETNPTNSVPFTVTSSTATPDGVKISYPYTNTAYDTMPSPLRWQNSLPTSGSVTYRIKMDSSEGPNIFIATGNSTQFTCTDEDVCTYPLLYNQPGTYILEVKNLNNNAYDTVRFTVARVVTTPTPVTNSCATSDPFTSLGGGTCQNGGWYPPGYPGILPSGCSAAVGYSSTTGRPCF